MPTNASPSMYLLRTPVVIPRDVACPCLPEMRIEGTRKLDLERLNARRFIPLENLTKARALAQRCILGPVVRYARSSSALRSRVGLTMMETAARGSCVCVCFTECVVQRISPSVCPFVDSRLCPGASVYAQGLATVCEPPNLDPSATSEGSRAEAAACHVRVARRRHSRTAPAAAGARVVAELQHCNHDALLPQPVGFGNVCGRLPCNTTTASNGGV